MSATKGLNREMERDVSRTEKVAHLRLWIPFFNPDSERIDTSEASHRRQAMAGRITGLAWLLVLGSPLSDLFRGHHSDAYVLLGLLGLLVFVAVYVYGFFRTFFQLEPSRKAWAVVLVLAALASAMSLGLGSMHILTMIFVVTAACASLPEHLASRLTMGIAVLTGAIAAVNGASVTSILSFMFQLVLIGIALIFLRRLIRTNAELRTAREENARLAVAEERLRFARDLHDLLGHSLSLIALKSELAGRLIEADAAHAASEVHDIEQVTRDALREVREAVSGYRQPALDAELIGARTALDAAGIQCDVVRLVGTLPSAVEATIGWALREGVTNVIRHSGATQCEIRIDQRQEKVILSIFDDGRGPMAPAELDGRSGNGLAGLSERVAAQGGEMTARPVAGGFKLTATIPTGDPPHDRDEVSATLSSRLALDPSP